MFHQQDTGARRLGALSILATLTVAVFSGSPAYSQCSGSPPSEVEEAFVATSPNSDAVSCATAIRDCGEFVIVWESVEPPSLNYINSLRVRRYNADGTAMGNLVQLNAAGAGYDPSVAMSRLGFVQVGWVGVQGMVSLGPRRELIRQGFDFDAFDFVAVAPPEADDADGDHEPSVGASDALEQMAG